MANTIYLEKRGCDFWDKDPQIKDSDVGNYRVGIYDHSIHCINGRDYILEFGHYMKYKTRTTNKRTGSLLKHPVRELINPIALYIDTEFERMEYGFKMSFCDLGLENVINNMGLSYTKTDILRVINMISEKKYDSIEIRG